MDRVKTLVAGLAAAGLLLGVAATALGHGMEQHGRMPGGGPGIDEEQAEQMGEAMVPGMGSGMMMGPGMQYGYGMGSGMMMGPGMRYGYGMGPGMMMGPGMQYGYGMGPGMMMGPGMHHGYGMHRGYGMPHGYGMHPRHGMHHGMMMGPGAGRGRGLGPRMFYGWPAGESRDISVEDARGWLERKLAWHGNPRLKLGEVTESDDDTIVAEIVTKDGSLVQKLAIDRHSGIMSQLEE